MRPAAIRRVDAVWVILSVITVASALMASVRGHNEFSPSRLVTVAVTVIAAVKARLVIREFMEVRVAPIWLRRLTDTWVLILLASVLGLYLAAAP